MVSQNASQQSPQPSSPAQPDGYAEQPTVIQQRASAPEANVWVGASAGTGKTKVLTDRVLRLLLPRPDGQPGTLPYRIICLTFTKAAANEMALRINKILGQWAVADDVSLEKSLHDLTGQVPTDTQKTEARKLFAAVVDTPGGLKVMTIHSFCQAILSRFPLEAGVSPHFNVMDEGPAREILMQAVDHAINGLTESDAAAQSLKRLLHQLNESQFTDIIQALCREPLQLLNLKKEYGDSYQDAIASVLGINPADTQDEIIAQGCVIEDTHEAGLRACCKALCEGSGKSDTPRGIKMQNWLDQDIHGRVQGFYEYLTVFLKKTDQQPLAKLLPKPITTANPQLETIMAAEADRLVNILDDLRGFQVFQDTSDLVSVGLRIITAYQNLKEEQGVMDYDDLIIKTKALLAQPEISPWILFKLDGGIDHILVDEAQDTNPEQWEIISKLCEDFYAGQSTDSERTRTIFVVGDEKQSIYSFQRAAPDEFDRMRAYFGERIDAAQKIWRPETMNTSFRSTQSVLELVDLVFAPEDVRQGLGQLEVRHHSARRGQEGSVTLWPLIEKNQEDPQDGDIPWTPPVTRQEKATPQAQMAQAVAETIDHWIKQGTILKSKGRPITPGDIMILVRTRTAFVHQLIRALKSRQIPVSGADRMVLSEQIAIQDILALLRFALLPDDDLNLACILKSPFVGWDDTALFDISASRSGSLWAQLNLRDTKEKHEKTVSWLHDLIRWAGSMRPYDMIHHILVGSCPANTESGIKALIGRLGYDVLDPVDELLNTALQYEADHTPVLQEFLFWFDGEAISIKRELEDQNNEVRIMTIHGAKGLQAPIVFLPDTTRTSQSKRIPRLLWPDKTGLPVPLWTALKESESETYRHAFKSLEDTMDEEYRRLLYVALTRAEDHLIVGGWAPSRGLLEESWYKYVERAFAASQAVAVDLTLEWPGKDEDGNTPQGLRLHNPQIEEQNTTKDGTAGDSADAPKSLPDWIYAPAPEEPTPPRPMTPSRPSTPDPAVDSPLQATNDQRFRRGNLTHKLLQFLPDYAADRREDAASRYIERQAHDLPEDVRDSIVRETLGIINHPDYSFLFSPEAQAEVAITGYVGEELISGQIDRLLITPDRITVLDYKTNRPPPTDPQQVPARYKQQMTQYRNVLATLYPERKIECLLLWTYGPTLIRLDELSYSPS